MKTDINGKPYSRPLLVTTLIIGVFCAVLNQTLLSTAQPTLMHVFSVSATSIQWLSTIYNLVVGVLMPITAWLADNINTRHIMISAYVIFILGTILCTFTPSFIILLIGRIIQALGGGLIMGITMTIMFNVFGLSERGHITSLMGIAFGAAPAIGPTLSGWLIQISSWRMVFGALLPFEIGALILGWFTMRNVIPHRPSKLDWLSVILSTIGFSVLLYGLSRAGDAGWGNLEVLAEIIVGLIFIGLFAYRQVKISNPVLNLKPFTYTQFSINVSIYMLVQMVMIGIEFLLPMYLQTVHLLSPMQSGMVMIAGAITTFVMSPISGSLVTNGQARRGIIFGSLLMAAASLPFSWMTATSSIVLIIILYAVRSVGLSLASMPAQTLAIDALPNNLISHGNAAMNMLRQIATSLGLSILVSTMSTITHATHSQLTGYHGAFLLAAIFALIAFGLAFKIKTKKAN